MRRATAFGFVEKSSSDDEAMGLPMHLRIQNQARETNMSDDEKYAYYSNLKYSPTHMTQAQVDTYDRGRALPFFRVASNGINVSPPLPPIRRSIPLTKDMVINIFRIFSTSPVEMTELEFFTFINNIFEGYTHTIIEEFPMKLSRFAGIIHQINLDRNDPDIYIKINKYIKNHNSIGRRGGRKNLRGINVLFSKKRNKSFKRMGKTKRLRKYNKKSTYTPMNN